MADEKNMFVDMEHEVMDFWEKEKCFEKLREKNRGHKMFRFLDGPITANNPMGIHHAWGRSIKDIFIRYHAMQGCDCRYQNGFDSQGLWVEVEVEKALGFKTKKDIENYGMDKFTKACKDRVKHFSEKMQKRAGKPHFCVSPLLPHAAEYQRQPPLQSSDERPFSSMNVSKSPRTFF